MTKKTIMVSGGFDPMHIGHLHMIEAASEYGDVIVALNSDKWLTNKKGAPFMPFDERFELISNIKGVTKVIPVDDDDGTVVEAIKRYKPDYFANGGDRVTNTTPELETCFNLEVQPLFGIGGPKIQSSSVLTTKAKQNTRQDRPWGCWEMLGKSDDFWIKLLHINPHSSLSLQKHEHRTEHWQLLKGSVTAITDKSSFRLCEGDKIIIHPNVQHRLVNDSDKCAIVVEVATGKILTESDIIRLDDEYGRG